MALAHQGELTRGLRAVLAQHILFAWNRAGIPAEHQALLATTAARVAFHTDPTHLGDLIGRLAGPVSVGRGDYPASDGRQHHHSQP